MWPDRQLGIPAPDPKELAGQVALVTAAAGKGIGEATARRLAAGGATVVVTDKHAGRTEAVVADLRELGADVVGHVLDVTKRDDISRVVDAVTADLGPIQILVNNAALNVIQEIWDYDVAMWDRIVEGNLTAPWLLCKAVLGHMRDAGGGSIVNVSTYSVEKGGAGKTAYGSTKAGLQGLTRFIAAEGGPHGIRCNTVSVGAVRGTKFVDDVLAPDVERWYPLNEWIWPEDVAETVAFLASRRARVITGATVDVSGGDHMRV